jgi:hypothetical protein
VKLPELPEKPFLIGYVAGVLVGSAAMFFVLRGQKAPVTVAPPVVQRMYVPTPCRSCLDKVQQKVGSNEENIGGESTL